jgi:hypothetical protein
MLNLQILQGRTAGMEISGLSCRRTELYSKWQCITGAAQSCHDMPMKTCATWLGDPAGLSFSTRRSTGVW